ncbi:MAG TPA: carboxypeptidase-like regulatory domain-containing protein [Pyrinomonadaceae bacterium]|nr:carboxypeptidase-like regulatory domain-containing protein [Pyrinomonadaceae bacterium]
MKLFVSLILAFSVCAGATLAQSRNQTLTIVVKGSPEHPVKHACVTLIPKTGELLFGQIDSRGRVRFKNVAQGEYRLVVRAESYELQKKEITVGPDDNTITFNLIWLDGTEHGWRGGQ